MTGSSTRKSERDTPGAIASASKVIVCHAAHVPDLRALTPPSALGVALRFIGHSPCPSFCSQARSHVCPQARRASACRPSLCFPHRHGRSGAAHSFFIGAGRRHDRAAPHSLVTHVLLALLGRAPSAACASRCRFTALRASPRRRSRRAPSRPSLRRAPAARWARAPPPTAA